MATTTWPAIGVIGKPAKAKVPAPPAPAGLVRPGMFLLDDAGNNLTDDLGNQLTG